MKSLGFHSKIKLNSREFHVHTGSLPEKNLVLSEIFEKGKFISSRNINFIVRLEDNQTQISYLKKIADKLHRETLEEIEMLFQVNSKVRLLKQYLPHFKLGSVFYHYNFLPEAIDNFQRVIDLHPEFVPAYLRLAKCNLRLEQYQNAVDVLENGLAIQPEFPDIANTLGVALTLVRDYERAIQILQQAIKKNPEFDEANFNLGVVLFRSTIDENGNDEKAVVPSRVVRFIKSIKNLERYSDDEWQNALDRSVQVITEGKLEEVLQSLENLQLKLITNIQINSLVESFYLKFMYGGRELSREELELYEMRVSEQAKERENFADFWNELGTIHMIQCRNLFLKSLSEFEKAVTLNDSYDEAKRNLDLIKNNKKGFLILLRAILK